MSRNGTVLLLFLAAVVGPARAGEWKGEEVDSDGVKHVMNPAESVEPPTTIELQEACEKLGLSKHTVQKRVDACRTKARNYLGREFDQKDWLNHKHKVSKKS